ncbi:hypothetical protein TRM7557_01353 [Tritonibacter multivorans]|uniref:Lipoprotein n=1 Tax=Tritonibacter multivorans TaxID=928856 RepID=A0A0P1GQ78_9RHOB|nr:hypothetical protein [Tritonibacter multivorans]MDA7421260.1 hypothetical protein [Tritonibacter multivorans]CUH77400.1 hypothetical protein TRM7557_01353 [Tritonibacter multivorans]SFD31470.1 hypothetical protein SAMN04488049_1119 [Tritonibacter multivorans]
MKLSIFLVCLAAGMLSACDVQRSPAQLYEARKPLVFDHYKNGATSDEIDRDVLDCQIEASQRVPQNLQVRTTPAYTTPVNTYCSGSGYYVSCNSYGGQTIGGDTYTIDVNSSLRAKARAQCVARKGYRAVSIPPCPVGVNAESMKLKSKQGVLALPKFSSKTCYFADAENFLVGEP